MQGTIKNFLEYSITKKYCYKYYYTKTWLHDSLCFLM